MTIDKNFFYENEVNNQELVQLLFNHFGKSSYLYNSMHLQKDGSNHFLDIRFNKSNKIREITASEDFPKEELEELRKSIKEILIDNQTIKYAQVICFTPYKKVEGYYRYKDLFQLIPITDDQPQTPIRFADHPCILQFSYTSSQDSTITHMRIEEKSESYIKVLSALLRDRIFIKSRRSTYSWIQDMDSQNNATWGKVGYVATNNFQRQIKEFSSNDNLSPINLISTQDYYGITESASSTRIRSMFEPFVLPEDISDSLNIAFNLPQKESKQFLTACTWYYLLQHFWEISHSAAFIAGIIAIESLRDKSTDEHCCECGQIKNITKNFKAFLRETVSFIEEMPEVEKLIYEIRSKLVHGEYLLLQDFESWNLFINPKALIEFKIEENVLLISITAIRNWLRTKETIIMGS